LSSSPSPLLSLSLSLSLLSWSSLLSLSSSFVVAPIDHRVKEI
jgi:hypothetical protein